MDIRQQIKDLVDDLNFCIIDWYAINQEQDPEFAENLVQTKYCCDENEITILAECFDIFMLNNRRFRKVNVLKGIIGYYYQTQVLEYNILELGAYNAIETKKNNTYKDKIGVDYTFVGNVSETSPLFNKVNIILKDPTKPSITYYINTRDGLTELPATLYFSKTSINDETMQPILRPVKIKHKHFDCLKEFYGKNKEPYEVISLITLTDYHWASQIRKKY